ncbi:OB-fold nucleic acid binding domain-containing protein, partial [Pseudoflavonifractor phocaeensis]|uniref:OB-fold nucleic acid binding domain-containing protein n=1 Tax=Pseudoflavonifractor phocaeensis TaxID=1870988 RepID=UPI001D1EE3D0
MVFLAQKFDTMVEGRNNRTDSIHGAVHALRDMGGITFVTLRTRHGLVQCVCTHKEALDGATEECAVTASGLWRTEPRAPGGMELTDAKLTVLSRPAAPPPVPLSKKKLSLNLDTELALRPVVLRTPRERAVFRIQAGICRAFRDFLQSQDFTEIHT